MKKNLAVAAAMAAGLCFGGNGHLKPAFAGHWEEVPNPFVHNGIFPYPSDPDYDKYIKEEKKRVDGEITIEGTNYLNGIPYAIPQSSYDWDENVTSDDTMRTVDWPSWLFGGPYMITMSGQVSSIFRWYPDGPNDINPTPLNLIGHFYTEGYVSSGDGLSRDTSKESAATSIDQEDGPVWDDGYSTISQLHKDKLINVPISSGSYNNDTGYFEVQVPWVSISNSAEVEFNGVDANINGDNDLSYGYTIDNRAVDISSSAEPTYHKGTNGAPEQNSPGTADVAATWLDTLNMWYWNGSFDANLSGSPWDSPTYTWAGSLLQYNQNNQNPGNVSSIGNAQYILPSYTEAAGPGEDPLSLAVSAEDTDGRYLVGTYSIKFHKTRENEIPGPVSYTGAGDSPYQPFSLMLDPVSVTNRGLLEYGQDTHKKDMEWANGLSLGSATLGTDGAILAVIPGTQPVGVALGAISMVMGGAATIVSSLPAAPAVYVPLNDTTYAKYKEAVVNANNDTTYPSGIKYYETDRIGANRTQFFANLIGAFVSDENGTGDPYYSAYTDVKGKAYFNPTKRTWTYDEYGSNGFSGQKSVIAYRNGENPSVEITWRENP